jgi:hypothetical protein
LTNHSNEGDIQQCGVQINHRTVHSDLFMTLSISPLSVPPRFPGFSSIYDLYHPFHTDGIFADISSTVPQWHWVT